MTTIEERLQIRRVPIDKWSVREQLCLASAVVRSGDQNWMSVSRALKPFAEPNRPPDWFSQKNCAAQYGSLLENVETPKRKKRMSGSETVVVTPGESILKKLVQERKMELRKKMEEEKREYIKLNEEMELIRSGAATDNMIDKMCSEIDEEEMQKEQDATAHTQWLKQREERKLEVERAFRPVTKINLPVTGQKRKASESIDASVTESSDESTPQEVSKPALSPLLTSLLKTPAHVPSVTSSILHSAITQRGTATSPTIASLLNTSASIPVSPSLQQLVSTAISQEPVLNSATNVPPLVSISITKPDSSAIVPISANTTATSSSAPISTVTVKEEKDSIKQIPAEESLLESSKIGEKITLNIESVKKEEIKLLELSEIKEENCEDKPAEEKEDTVIKIEDAKEKSNLKLEAIIEETIRDEEDIYEFDNNSKTSCDEIIIKESNADATNYTDTTTYDEQNKPSGACIITNFNKEGITPMVIPVKGKDVRPGIVEIVEVLVMEDDDSDKEMNKKVSEIKRDIIKNKKEKEAESEFHFQKETKPEEKSAQKETTVYDEYDFDDIKKPEEKPEEKSQNDVSINIDAPEFSRKSTFTPEFSETFYDDMSIEVTKQEKFGKAKRDYSRTRKKEEKDIEMLLAVEKAVSASLEENEVLEETSSEKDSHESDKKSDSSKHKLKDNTERSNSPWTEEEEVLPRTRRRLSVTPATPNDSIPNSPASGTAVFDDDRDYRTWKKSVMLIYSRLAAHKCASLFLKPITDEHAPGYHSIVYRPMDLQTIRKNIENGVIRTTAEFHRDVMVMFTNALMYNKREETVYEMARQMQAEALQQIHILQNAQTQMETPARRETRTSESGIKRKRQDDLLTKNKKRRDD